MVKTIGILICCVVLTFLSNSILAQQNINSTASDAFKVLKDGFVIVRLHVNDKKRAFYQSKFDDALNQMEKEEWQKELNSYEAEKKDYVQKMMYGFKNWFNLCPVYFYYDFDQKLIKDGQLPDGIFLNERGEKDKTIIPPKKEYLCIIRKESNFSLSASSSLQVLNKDGIEIPKPFPQIKAPSFLKSFFHKAPKANVDDEKYDESLEIMLTKWQKMINKSK